MVFLQDLTKSHLVFITMRHIIMKENMMMINLRQIKLTSNAKHKHFVRFNLRSLAGYVFSLTRNKLFVSHILLMYYLCNVFCAAALPAVIPLGKLR